MLLISLPKLSSREFGDRMNALLKENEIVLEEKDFPFLNSTMNSILSSLIDYKSGETPLESYLLDTKLFLAFNNQQEVYSLDIEEVRFLIISSLEEYFKDKDSIRVKGFHVDKLNMEVT